MNTENKKLFQQKMLNPIFFKLFLILKLPLAFLAGVKLKFLNDELTLNVIGGPNGGIVHIAVSLKNAYT
jgi:hypothetical protein